MKKNNKTIVKQSKNNKPRKAPPAGFNVNPQNINKKGRPPKGHSITDAVKDLLNSEPETKKKIIQMVGQKAMEGDMAALRLIWNYMDGMPKQTVEIDDPRERLQEMKDFIDQKLENSDDSE